VSSSPEQAVEQAYRDEWSRLLALLVTRLRRFDIAEDSLQDAYAAASRVWPSEGVPERPAAWLYTTAYRRALDRIRREETDARRLPLLLTDPTVAGAVAASASFRSDSSDPSDSSDSSDDEIPDERLRLLFACCHPALRPDARAALMLRFVAGLTTAEIARLFLVSEPTMAARLTRAKAKMAVAGIPLRRPAAEDLPERLDVVLAVLYLIFTEGYRATAGPDLVRPRLAAEAIRLGYLLGELLPGEPSIVALLSLMLLQHARRDARVAADGTLVLLPDQDRTHWHHDEIARGLALLNVLEAVPMSGEYHLQALIAAEHARPAPGPASTAAQPAQPAPAGGAVPPPPPTPGLPDGGVPGSSGGGVPDPPGPADGAVPGSSGGGVPDPPGPADGAVPGAPEGVPPGPGLAGAGSTDWPRIARLYAELERRTGSPVVRLNRAVAIAEAGSPEAALALLDGLDRALAGSHLLPAVRAELFARLHRPDEAEAAFDQALALVRTEPERIHLTRRRAALGDR
jgi:RNA polymerase sigma-70 factor (ECF subfamily)